MIQSDHFTHLSQIVLLFSAGNFGDRYFGTDAPPDWSDEDMDEPSYWLLFLFLFLLNVHPFWTI